MGVTIGKMIAVDCGMGICTSSTTDLQVGSLETTRCGIGIHIRDDVNNADLEYLLNEISNLKTSSKSERASIEEAITLIQAQIVTPSPIKIFRASLVNIVHGAAGSGLYDAICTAFA